MAAEIESQTRPVVYSISSARQSHDSDGESSSYCTSKTWVMSHGLEINSPVQYLEVTTEEGGYSRYGVWNANETRTLASGVVQALESETEVVIKWGGVATLAGSVWKAVQGGLEQKLDLNTQNDSKHSDYGRRSSDHFTLTAKRLGWSNNKLEAPEEAWSLIGDSLIPFTDSSNGSE